MNALERLGLQVCAERLLGNRGTAAILMALIEAKGKPVKYSSSATIVSRRKPNEGKPSHNSFKARICWLRAALRDVGLENVVLNDYGNGYTLPEPERSRVIERLREEANA